MKTTKAELLFLLLFQSLSSSASGRLSNDFVAKDAVQHAQRQLQSITDKVQELIRVTPLPQTDRPILFRSLQQQESNQTDSNVTDLLESTTAVPTTTAPTETPYVSDYFCILEADFYACVVPRPDYFDEAFPDNTTLVIYVCNADLGSRALQGARIADHCTHTSFEFKSLCLVQIDGNFCSGCTILHDGTMAYNCDNLIGVHVSSCSNRNDVGQCNRGHSTWTCQASPHSDNPNKGFLCYEYSLTSNEGPLSPANGFLPLLPTDVASTLSLFLFCENLIYGKHTLGACGTKCQLPSIIGNYPCDICRMIPDKVQDIDATLARGENILAYDCSTAYPGANCASTDVNGECFDVLQQRKERNFRCSYINAPEVAAETEQFWKRSRVLSNIDARTFNVVSDLVGTTTRALTGLCIALAYPILMSWYLQRPQNRGSPLSALDALNGGLFSAARAAFSTNGATPTVLLFVILLLAEISHPLADVGFEPVTEPFKGEDAPVLSLRTEHRNKERPMDLMGDPPSLRFSVYKEAIDPSGRVPIIPIYLRSPEVEDFIAAIRLVATGGSPFTRFFGGSTVPATFGGLSNFTTRVGIPCETGPDQPPLPLVSIPLEIPLSCAQGVDSMTPVPQIMDGIALYDDPLRAVTRVPNCTLTGERDTGIYHGSASVETANILEFTYASFSSQIEQDVLFLPIFLIVNGNLTGQSR